MARYALVIGVATYNNFRNLEKAVTDAEAIAQLLELQGNFQEVKRLPAKWLKDEGRWAVTGDKKLTGKELGHALRSFLLEQAAKNEAVIYFAGHGFPVSSCMGVEEGYLATSDCSEDGRNGIPLRHLNALMVESDLSSLVVMLDCCYGGTLLERQLLEPTFTAFNTKRDYYLITACRGFQKAYEGVEHGVFTGAILKGLAAENADEKGQVSGDRLFDFIASALKSSSQEPIRMGWGRSITLVQYPPKKTAVVVNETCPYQGLKAFDKEQARFFFGREKVVQWLMEKLGQANFVPIIGASGSGKSSVVRAGLIPQLEKNGWRVLEPIMPGVEPLAELKRALLGLFGRTEVREIYALIETDGLHPVINRLPSSERLLLVIDQFEEVFTVCPKEEERRRFIELLTQVAEIPASRLAIVTTMRADFLEPCLSYGSLTRLIQDEAVYMPPLVGAELEEAIEEPTKLQGYSFEKGLLGEILRDVGQEKECLPLLQFALMELWEKRDRTKHQLTVDQYRDLGGVNGALNRHADKIYTYNDFLKEFPQQERSPQEEEWIKRIFLKLVRTGEGIKDTRQRQHRANLLAIAKNKSAHEEAIVKVLDELIQGRLLVTGQEEQQTEAWVDLAHEALMDGWKLFAKWRQENRDLRRLRERIDDAYREWSRARQDKNLMMGGLLDQAKERWLELEPDVSPSIEEFYNKSVTHERNTVEQQAQFERAKHRYINPKYAEFLNFDDLQRLRNRTRAKASILFSGIRDYNSISQGLDDEELSSLSHQYHESMREAIFAYRGSISTYRHNEIMAVFGWPLLLEDHAWEAVLSSIKMRQWLEEFNAHRKEKYKVPIKIGIGIDSDLVRVNYGSIQSLDLTVLGEAVGLSQYLEGASEQYGCDIVISGNTFKPCTERIWFRELDWIRVKGKNGRVAIYEVVGLRSDPISPEKQKMIELYHKGRECYVNRKFTSAMGKFGFILEEIDKNDKAAALYLKYCQHYLQEPPPDDWDGAWTIAD